MELLLQIDAMEEIVLAVRAQENPGEKMALVPMQKACNDR
jgi:hypothetical protein